MHTDYPEYINTAGALLYTMNNKLMNPTVTIPILRFTIDLLFVCLNPRGCGGSNTLVLNPKHQHTP